MKNKWWLGAFIVCLALAALSPLASASPDGLESIAQDQGFAGMAVESPLFVMGDYLFPGVHNQAVATMLAGWLGVVIVFSLAYAAAFGIIRWRARRSA